MAEQAASLANSQEKALKTPDQSSGGLKLPEEGSWRTRATTPFLDYLLTEGNEPLEPLVTRDTEYRSSYYKVGVNFGRYIGDQPFPGAGSRLKSPAPAVPDSGSPSWQNSRRSADRLNQRDDDFTEVLSAVRALYEPLLPQPTALHPIAEQEVPCTDDFDPWSFLCETPTDRSSDMPHAVERYNSTDSCASLVHLPMDIGMALCEGPSSPSWALASSSSEPMLLEMPVAMAPSDGVGAGLQTGMSWGSPDQTAPAAESLALLAEEAIMEDLPGLASLRNDVVHQPATNVEEHNFPSPLSIWQDLSQPEPINMATAGTAGFDASPMQGISLPLAGKGMAVQDATTAWHQQVSPGTKSGRPEGAQSQETHFGGGQAAVLASAAQATTGRGLNGQLCPPGGPLESPATAQRNQPVLSASPAKAGGSCRALFDSPVGMGPTAFTFTSSDSLAAFLEQHMGPLTATPPRESADAELPAGCPQAPKASRALDLHPGLSQGARCENAACQSSFRPPSGDMAQHGGVSPFPVWQGLCHPEPLAHHLKAAPSPGKEAPAPAAQCQQAMMSPVPEPAPGQATGRKALHVAAAASNPAQKPANQVPPAAQQEAVTAAVVRAAAQCQAAAVTGATETMVQTQGTGLSRAAGATLVRGPSTALELPSCPFGQGGRQPQCQAQPAAAAAAAATMKDISGSEEKADNDCNDDDKNCSAEEENKVAKRNRTHQKDYTQRKRSRVAAVHNCALELKKRRAELEAEVATVIAKHQTLTDALPWGKQLEEIQFMAMLGSFRTGSLKELEKAVSTSNPTYMQDPLEACESIVWTGGHAATGKPRSSWADEMESMQASMSPIARRVLFGAADIASPAAKPQAPPMSELVAKIRLSKTQKSELAAEARRAVTSMEMMHDDSAAAAERLQGSLPLSLGSLHNIWRGMLVTHTVIGQLSGIPKMAAECSAHLVSTCAEVLKPPQAKKLPCPVNDSLSMCLSLCEEVERIRHRQGAVCRASVVADAAPVPPKAAVS